MTIRVRVRGAEGHTDIPAHSPRRAGFVDAVEQVVASLPVGLDFDGALQLLNELPPALETHAGIAAAQQQLVPVLAQGIDACRGISGSVIRAEVDALVMCLGPVAQMVDSTVTVPADCFPTTTIGWRPSTWRRPRCATTIFPSTSLLAWSSSAI